MEFEEVRYFDSCGRDIHTGWAYGMEAGRVSQIKCQCRTKF